MSRTQRKYDQEYKIQAVKLAKEIGGAKAAKELGIPEGTIHTWLKAVKAGTLDISDGAHTPESAMSLAEELAMLRKRVKDQDKEIRRDWSWSKAFAGTGHPGDVRLVPIGVERRPRSHRMKFCVQRGLGALPRASKLATTLWNLCPTLFPILRWQHSGHILKCLCKFPLCFITELRCNLCNVLICFPQ